MAVAYPYAGGEFNHSGPLSSTFNHLPCQGSTLYCALFDTICGGRSLRVVGREMEWWSHGVMKAGRENPLVEWRASAVGIPAPGRSRSALSPPAERPTYSLAMKLPLFLFPSSFV